MSKEWYYFQSGNQAGPVDDSAIQQLLQSGRLQWDDLVWCDGMPDWLAAAQVPELASLRVPPAPAPEPMPPPFVPPPAQPAPAQPEPAPPPQAPPVEAPAAALTPIPSFAPAPSAPLGLDGVSDNTVAILAQTRPWVRLVGILTFVGIGLMVLGGLAGMIGGVVSSGGELAGVGIGVAVFAVYLLAAALMVPLALFLNRYAKAIGVLRVSRRAVDLERALLAQKSYWKYVGILTIVGIGLSVLVIIAALLFGLAGVLAQY